MPTIMRTLCRFHMLVALLFILVAAGCGTSSLGSYQSAFSSSSGPKFNLHEWKFEHNFLNSKYQSPEKEDWEDEGPG
jgi:hypothetical protein